MNKKIPRILKNKYVICTVLFFVVAFFVEDNNITTSLALKEKKEVMENEKLFLKEAIKQDSIKIEIFKNNPAEYEKYARENYYMKRTNEDIIIINREK